jgi:sugar phosphate isomerase/epimerase
MHLGYVTNGFAHHSLPAAIELLAGIGYRSVAITLDHNALNPYGEQFERETAETAELLAHFQLRSVVETGARFLLDPAVKHEPTLVSQRAEDRLRRIDFLKRSIDLAALLGSDCVSIWSGVVRHAAGREAAMADLTSGLQRVLDYADRREVDLGFEPEPDMLIDTTDSFAELLDRVDSPRLKLTLDVGHLHCLGETPIPAIIRRWGKRIANVHIEDMRAGVHDHLMFGEGEMDFPPIIAALAEVGYDGGVHVELSRHSHDAPYVAQQAFDFLSPMMMKG